MGTDSSIYYFGTWGEPGHYLFRRGADSPAKVGKDEREEVLGIPGSPGVKRPGRCPWGYAVDGGLCNSEAGRQGAARVTHQDGWTAFSFPDRSVDSRYGSHSTFLFEAPNLSFDQAHALARAAYPAVFERFDFDVVPDNERGS